MKNRKREICTSGSVRDEDGQPPHLLGHRRQFLHLAAGAATLPVFPRVARAQAYPSRPVRIIVGFAPGQAIDIVTRMIGQRLSERLGEQFIIDNRPGAGGNIATEAVVRALPDGYTLLAIGSNNLINATLYQKLNYNFIQDIAPVASIYRVPQVMEVNPSFPAKTVPEFIAYAKAHPGEISFASAGNGLATGVTHRDAIAIEARKYFLQQIVATAVHKP
jgi:tripartite-type tricarboxylate transporter receptor subunit TctC